MRAPFPGFAPPAALLSSPLLATSLLAASLLAASLLARPLAAQQAATAPAQRLTVERIVNSGDFRAAPGPSVHWLKDGRSYVETRESAGGGTDIVRVDAATGATTVLAAAGALRDERGRPLEIEEFALSDDERQALVFHSSVRVWRTNTRGVFHVVDFRTGKVTPIATAAARPAAGRAAADSVPAADTANAPMLGKNERSPSFLARGLASGAADPDLQMFAKFSPDGRAVAFVRGNDLWVKELAGGAERRLTTDGSDDVINGTTDWVYEEELGLSDAFRWSPDSKRIAYWRFDQREVPAFPMVDETGLYPRVSVLRYPKAGAPNARVQVGVLDVASARTRWLEVGGDTGIYLARMEWVGSDSLTVLRLPRKQNRLDVLMLSATTGTGRTLLTERDSAYVDVEDQPVWVNGGRQFLWSSDRSGWRQLYLYDRSGRLVRQVTRDGVDVVGLAHVDDARGELYAVVAAPDPRARTVSQREVHRFSVDGKRAARLTREPGTHAVVVAPGSRYLVDTWSTASQPPTVTLYELPAMRRVRVLEDNAAVKANLAAANLRAPEFFKLPVDGAVLDAYRIVPADFDSTRAYPVLMYVYGGPASPTVNDAWGGTRYLWHQLLAQRGYVVVSVDNRGAAWRGRDFRKVTQYRLGRYESADQLAVARWLGARRWVDPKRIGVWGWSYGGYLSTLTAAKGGELFRAAIAVAPVADWRLYDTIYTERFMWTPQQNPEGYAQGAPLAHVEGLKARYLLAHGTGDDNVHPQNSIQLADRLQAAGVPFYMLLYPNRTHSISGGNSTAHLYESMTRFLLENL